MALSPTKPIPLRVKKYRRENFTDLAPSQHSFNT
jgi:hypothetical protein